MRYRTLAPIVPALMIASLLAPAPTTAVERNATENRAANTTKVSVGTKPAPIQDINTVVWFLTRNPIHLNNVYHWQRSEEDFYTTDPSGDLAPGNGYISNGIGFAVVKTRMDETVPLYHLHRDVHLYTVSDEERATALGNGFSDLGVVGYIFKNQSPGLIPLYSWYNPQTQNRILSIDMHVATQNSAAYSYEGVTGYVFQTEYPDRVGAYYFGMFSPRAFESGSSRVRNNIQRIYGLSTTTDFWWAGVRDMYEHNITPVMRKEYPRSPAFFAVDSSFLKPAIGWYNQNDPKVLEKHINQAISNGISYFNFYWFWDVYLQNEGINDGLDSFLQARNSKNIDFMISICGSGFHWAVPAIGFERISKLIVQKYLGQPNYLKARDGRPIVEMCKPTGIRASVNLDAPRAYSKLDLPALTSFIATLRREAKLQLGKEIIVTAVANSQSNAIEMLQSAGVDGGTCITSNLDSSATKAAGWSNFMPCLAENFDARPRIGISKHPPIAFKRRPTAEQFASMLSSMKVWMDSRPSDYLSRYMTIYAWNEWHEGGIIEPNVQDGAAFLNKIAPSFNTGYIPLGCRVTGLCPDAAH